MKTLRLISGPLKVNAYFLIDEIKRSAVVIDGGENYKLIKRTAEEQGVTIKALLLTHGHFDHSGSAAALQRDGAKVYISEKDASMLNGDGNLGYRFGRNFEKLTADYFIKDGDVIKIDGIELKAIATAGHTAGSMTFMTENMLFTGDTMFSECYGRTDFPTGSDEDMQNSLVKLLSLDGEFNVYPGHEEFTTLSHERGFYGERKAYGYR